MTDTLSSSLQSITQNPDIVQQLTAQKISTIFDITKESIEQFCQALVNVPEDQKEAIYHAASARVATLNSINRTLSARNEPTLQGIAKLGIEPRPAQLQAAIGRSLGGAVEFDDLFDERSHSYAEVTSIQSLFSPGRYLVELYKLAKGLHAQSSPLYIETRRPDIKDLVLNDKNLNQEISTLSILNEILLKGIEASPGTPDLQALETLSFPMTLPYHDNLVQVRSVLANHKLSLQQLWAALADDQLTVFSPLDLSESIGSAGPVITPSPATREQLQLAPQLYAMLGTAVSDDASTKLHYGLAADADIATQLKSVEAFSARTGLTFNQLIEMTAQADFYGSDAPINDLIDNLAPGQSHSVTFNFSQDPGTTFSSADVIVANGTLGPISGSGTTRTATVTSNAANLLSNGSFAGGSTAGWTTTGGVTFNTTNAHMSFEDQANPNGIIQQTVATIVGKTYVVQFWVGGHNDTYPSCTATAQALNGTTVLASLPTTATHGGATVQFTFVAASTTTIIKLVETYDDPSNEYYFDDFVVAPVPTLHYLMKPRFWRYGDTVPTNVNIYGQTYLCDGHSDPSSLLIYPVDRSYELNLSSANAVNYCDRAQRLIRLQRKVNVPFHELDWLIKNANGAVQPGRPLQLDTPVLGIIGEFFRLSSTYGISSDEFACFIGDMNTYASQAEQSLYQRLFTSPSDGTTLALNATLNFDSSVHSAATAVVCGALKVSADELQQIAQLAFNLNAPEAVLMSSTRYAQLYRLAMIPRMLGLSFTQAKVLWDLINPGQDSAKQIAQANSVDTLRIIRQTEAVLAWMGDNQLDLPTLLSMTTSAYSPVLTPELFNFTHNLFTSLNDDSGMQPVNGPLPSAVEQRLYQAIAPVFGCKPNVMAKLLQWQDVFFRLQDGTTPYGLGDYWADVKRVHSAQSGTDITQASANVARYSQGMAQYALIAQWAGLTEQDLNLIVESFAWFMVVPTRSAFSGKSVNTFVTGDQGSAYFTQGMTSLADGGWVVTWNSQGQAGSGSGVYLQRFDANGMPVGAETQVNTTKLDNPSTSRVTTLANGGWVVTWTGLQVYLQCFDTHGAKVGSEISVGPANGVDNWSSVAALPGGGWIIAFQDNSSPNTPLVKQQQYTATGTPVGGIISVTTRFGVLPAITALSGGGWVVGWAALETGNFSIHTQAYNADGSKRGLETQCSALSTVMALSGLSDGGWLVVWLRDSVIYQQRYDANGLAKGSQSQVNTTTSDPNYPAVCGLTGGGWVVTWQNNYLVSASSGDDIYQQHFDSLGNRVGGEELVNTLFTAGEQTTPNITATANGGWTISWVSAAEDGSGLGIYQQHYNVPSNAARPSPPLLLRVARLKKWLLRTVVPASSAIGYFALANQPGQTSAKALDTLATIQGWNSKQTALMNDALVNHQIYKDFPKCFDDVCRLETWMQASAHLNVGSGGIVQLYEMSKPNVSAEASSLISGAAEQLMATLTQ
ncbi:hypothetical protein KBJ94_27995 [Pseudomonas sp. ITA]|uniref:Tc toxin subunit A n=1 Tax=Pseudomonas sp. ITA TaxID=2825841 RepID=UPI002495F740|nr:Tc toxin subunit A [Pseudomonas sp. ITA]MDI2145891.1 hypothetical protein [Pseudomonas sp. ITA]